MGQIRRQKVCYQGIFSIYVVTDRRVQNIQQTLIQIGMLPEVNGFIKFLSGRKAHYSIEDPNKIYLLKALNIPKGTYGMFNDDRK